MTKKGADEAQLEGVSVHVCGESSLCADESHLIRNNSFMISEITSIHTLTWSTTIFKVS